MALSIIQDRRSRLDMIGNILLETQYGPVGRYRLSFTSEMGYAQLQRLLVDMEFAGLIKVDHRGVSITEKGMRAAILYDDLRRMVWNE